MKGLFDKYVCFGLSGILLNVNPNWEDAWQQCRDNGWNRGIVTNLPELQSSATGDLAKSDAFRQYQEGRLSPRVYFLELFKYLWDTKTIQSFEPCGRKWSSLSQMDKEIVQIDMATSIHCSILQGSFISGAINLLGELSAKEIQYGYLVNTDETHYQINKKFLNLSRAICSHKVGFRKPSQEIFSAFVTCWGTPVIYFDNNLDNIVAAKAYGWHESHHIQSNTPIEDIRQILNQEINLDKLKIFDTYNDI